MHKQFFAKKIVIPAFSLVIPAKAGIGSIQCVVKRSQIYLMGNHYLVRIAQGWGPYPCLRRDDTFFFENQIKN